ncbi:MAG: TonB family protein [Sphingobacteriales bacterium]|nr:MAG: TonB family protein [Sphingobacteriales bacterium]
MKLKSKPEKLVKQPNYPGGKKAMDEFIRTLLQYPEEAIKNKIEGAVAIEYNVDVFGNVMEAKIKHAIGYGCDEEAIRLVKLLKYEKKKYQGLQVVFHKSLIINFHLNNASVSSEKKELKINYQLTEARNPSSETKIIYTIIPEKSK